MWNKYHYSHFTDEEIKAQRDDIILVLVFGFQVSNSPYCAALPVRLG